MMEYDDSILASSSVFRGSEWLRLLASDSKDTMQIDYSVLACVVMTLGLVMVVEVCRHRLDHAAKGRPLFLAVLEGVYAELSTLGIVELCIWLVHTYHENLDYSKYVVFSKVHFALFFTAIFNAFQSVFVAYFSMRVSRYLWIRTEMLELNHYVEIREEFERVKDQLQRLTNIPVDDVEEGHEDQSSTEEDNNENNNNRKGKRSFVNRSFTNYFFTERGFQWNRIGLRRLKHAYCVIRYPHLQRRYNRLLIQVRFHELRVHFLQAYKLPMKLKISDYLMRSEKAILIKLVHVMVIAWLLLTGCANLLYYILGVASYQKQNVGVIGIGLEVFFFLLMGGSVLLSVVLYGKMSRSFQILMHQKVLWDFENQGAEVKEKLATKQLELFWFGNPSLVISAIQFMQFCFAAALAVVLVFWNDIASGPIDTKWYLLVIALTYPLFVFVTAKVIPQYTLCTSLGQLVNRERLHETVSIFRLGEAKRRRLEQIELQTEFRACCEVTEPEPVGQRDTESPSLPRRVSPVSGRPVQVNKEKSASELFADLVRLDTPSLRTSLPADELDALARREGRKRLRRSTSDGVKLMASTIAHPGDLHKPSGGLSDHLNAGGSSLDVRLARQRSRKKSVSDGVTLMASVFADDSKEFHLDEPNLSRMGLERAFGNRTPPRPRTPVDFELVKSDTKCLRSLLSESERQALEHREARRRSRVRSASEGVSRMANLRKTLSMSSSCRDDSDVNTFSSQGSSGLTCFEELKPDDTSPDKLRARRRIRGTRTKSVSDGVAFMASLHEGMPDFASRRKADAVPVWVRTKDADAVTRSSSMVVPDVSSTVQAFSGAIVLPTVANGSTQLEEPQPSFLPMSLQALVTTTHRPVQKGTQNLLESLHSVDEHNSTDQLEEVVKHCGDASINSTESDADSDGSLPDIDPTYLLGVGVPDKKPTLREKLRLYYLSRKFPLLSNVFGTMIAFFFLGERVESFISSQGFTDDTVFVSFYFPNIINFWVLFTWFLMFLVTSCVIFWTFGSYSSLSSSRERAVVLSAVMDVMLTTFCLVVFCVAEVQRCCYPVEDYGSIQNTSRFLAGEEVTGGNDTVYSSDNGGYNLGPAPCSCPAFGSRYYGGLGRLEPLASLIALRLFRFWIARLLLRRWDYNQEERRFLRLRRWDPTQKLARSEMQHDTTETLNPFDVYDESHHDDESLHDNRSHMESEHGSIVELWQTAVERYPDIVSKYGEFSGELLQAMLGVPVTEAHSMPTSQHEPSATISGSHRSTVSSPPPQSNRRLALENQYSNLTPKAQEVIMAGKLGRAVKSMRGMNVVEEDEEAQLGEEGRSGSIHFEIDLDRENTSDFDSVFTVPSARLVRNMRRGERKMLPFLNKWSVVDVVMTRFEIVYFDATDADGSCLDQARKVAKQAIVATKGGKGLRLCDVAVGRRVIGHLTFSDMETVFVERELPHAPGPNDCDSPGLHVSKIEFWQNRSVDDSYDRASHWCNIKQDVLKIHTTGSGTLFIRFYSDLADTETNPDRMNAEAETEGPLFKNTAFLWAQTLMRFCGPEQLKQPLPHYGKDTSDELRDFLKIKHAEKKGQGHRRVLSRGESFWQLPRVASTTTVVNSPKKPAIVRRATTTAQDLIGYKLKKPAFVRRAVSDAHDPRHTNRPVLNRSSSASSSAVHTAEPVLHRSSSMSSFVPTTGGLSQSSDRSLSQVSCAGDLQPIKSNGSGSSAEMEINFCDKNESSDSASAMSSITTLLRQLDANGNVASLTVVPESETNTCNDEMPIDGGGGNGGDGGAATTMRDRSRFHYSCAGELEPIKSNGSGSSAEMEMTYYGKNENSDSASAISSIGITSPLEQLASNGNVSSLTIVPESETNASNDEMPIGGGGGDRAAANAMSSD